jgi:hypothetical protein
MARSQPRINIKSTNGGKYSEKDWKTFGKNVLFLREDVVWKVSQADFGAVIGPRRKGQKQGYARTTIYNIENAKPPHPPRPGLIASVFGLTESDLFAPDFIKKFEADPERKEKARSLFLKTARERNIRLSNAPADPYAESEEENVPSLENGPFPKDQCVYFPVLFTALAGDTIHDLWRKAVKGEAIPIDPTWTDVKRYVLFQCQDDSMHPVISRGDRLLVDVENSTGYTPRLCSRKSSGVGVGVATGDAVAVVVGVAVKVGVGVGMGVASSASISVTAAIITD